MNIVKTFLFLLVIALGVVMFVYAGIDDSPGGQLIGVIVVGSGCVGLYRGWVARKR